MAARRCRTPAAALANAVHNAWLAGEGHRANMLRPQYGRVAIAVVSADKTFYVAEIFLD